MQRYTSNDCIESATKRNGLCLNADMYKNIDVKLNWKCAEKHEWSATYRSIRKSNSWCPYCAGNAKLTIEYCRNEAIKKGGECKSENYINNRTDLEWKCSVKEHPIFPKNLTHVLEGQWCRLCSDKPMPLTLKECQELAKLRNGICKNRNYINNRTLMRWKCGICNTKWENNFDHIKSGQWCPKCAINNNKSENMMRDLLEKYTGKKFPNVRPDFMKHNKTGKNLELDCYNEELKLAFEYHGRQHYRYCPDLFHKKGFHVFKNQLARDVAKYKLCFQNNIRLIVIPYYKYTYLNYKEFKAFIKLTLKKFKIEIINTKKLKDSQTEQMNKPEEIAENDSKSEYTLKDCQTFVKNKNGKCLSDEFIDIHTPIRWQCGFDHEPWEASFNELKNNESWCPKCNIKGYKYTLQDCQTYAKNQDGECLSDGYEKNRVMMRWGCNRCKNNNITKTFTSVLRYNICKCDKVNIRKFTIEDCQAFAKTKNGFCLSGKADYVDIKSSLNWKCKNGHIWHNSFHRIKNEGYWCNDEECKQ